MENGQAVTSGYLPLDRAAAGVGVSPRTLKRWIEHGLPVYQAVSRGKLLIRPADIDAFLIRRERQRTIDVDQVVGEVFEALGG